MYNEIEYSNVVVGAHLDLLTLLTPREQIQWKERWEVYGRRRPEQKRKNYGLDEGRTRDLEVTSISPTL